jgi:hypothetical protein
MMMMIMLRLQHGKEFHNLVYMSYVKHINPSNKAYMCMYMFMHGYIYIKIVPILTMY